MLDPTLYGLLTQIENDEIVLPAMYARLCGQRNASAGSSTACCAVFRLAL